MAKCANLKAKVPSYRPADGSGKLKGLAEIQAAVAKDNEEFRNARSSTGVRYLDIPLDYVPNVPV